MKLSISWVATCLVLAAVNVNAGEPVRAVSKDLGEAMDKTIVAVERAATVAGTCVSEYPKLESCNQVHGHWQCVAIRANHKGSCAQRPTTLDDVIKAAKGFSAAAAQQCMGGGS